MGLRGINAVWLTHWLKGNRVALPSLIALAGVAAFWAVGVIGGISFLTNASSLMTTLTGLYVMLAAVAVSIIITTLALTDLARRFSRQRGRR